MKSQSLVNFPMVELTIAALLIFVMFFIVTCVRTYSRRNNEAFNRISSLPLEEGRHHVRQE